jgi:hypothetical protein
MAIVLLTTLAVLLSVASWFVLYQLIKQRGRLLLRLDELERRLREIDSTLAS